MPIESYRERMRQLLISVDNASSEEEKNELQRQIEELEKEFQRNLPEMSVTSEYTFKGGKQHNKSKKKYKNKLRIRKHKNTKRRRRH
jgi:flagellin-like hook-associated protein FlgL